MVVLTDEIVEEIINKYYQTLFNIAYSYTKDSFDAEDIVQDVFIKFYRARNTFNDDEHIKYWLIRVTINDSLNLIKSKRKVIINTEYISTLQEEKEQDDDLYHYVCMLNEKDKRIIILFYYDNYSTEEIAKIFNLSESSVRSRLSRAREKLRKIIERGRENARR